MRILVVSAFEALSHWAHAINTIKMAQGFARLGHQVSIVCHQCPEGKVPPRTLAESYGLTAPIHWVQLPSIRWPQPPQRLFRRFAVEHWNFALLALPVALWKRPDLVLARNYIFPWLSSKLGMTTVAEAHTQTRRSNKPFLRLVAASRHRAFRLWITTSECLTDYYHSLGVPREKLVVLQNGVDLRLFQRPPYLPASPFSNDGPNIVYTGHLYDYKGIPTILEAAAQLSNVHFHLVGGWPDDISRQKQRARELGLTNVTFHGLKPHSAIPLFLWHANVLLLPPSAHHPSAAWTSPVKLGEYLASGVPVVATSIPALRDWLTDAEAKFVDPDDPKSLAQGIIDILKDPEYATALSQQGLKKAETLSYEHRAERILQRLS
jgi:glycosyltransferase involved in cell wall biosynthesis